jgi:FAD/FMN-containing dehydrogenase
VRNELTVLESLVSKFGALSTDAAFGELECEALWDLRRGFSESLKATGLTKLNQDVTVPRGRLVDLVRFAAELQKRSGFPIACFGHAGDGNIHVNVMVPDPDDPKSRERMDETLDALFAQIIAWDGAITGEHGIGLAKKRWWPQAVSPENLALHQTIKSALDPKRILNPGKFL